MQERQYIFLYPSGGKREHVNKVRQHFYEVQLFRALADFVYMRPFSQMDNEMIFTLILGYFSGFEENVLPFIQQPL